jgi:hypothetical protein
MCSSIVRSKCRIQKYMRLESIHFNRVYKTNSRLSRMPQPLRPERRTSTTRCSLQTRRHRPPESGHDGDLTSRHFLSDQNIASVAPQTSLRAHHRLSQQHQLHLQERPSRHHTSSRAAHSITPFSEDSKNRTPGISASRSAYHQSTV